MKMFKGRLILSVMMLLALALSTSAAGEKPKTEPATAVRDGRHDFDFWFGKWKVHNRRLMKPLTGSTEWVQFDGTSVARPLWDGRANIDEFEADAPSGHIEGMTVRTYNAKTGDWSLYWANAANGVISLPATVGHFTDAHKGEFFDQETFNGKPIVVRYTWTVIDANSCRWEQAFSADGGKTWETNWISENTRVKE
jgi:hypothetical protein